MTPQSSAFQAKEAGCSRQPASFACLNFNINHDTIHASDFPNISGDRLMLRVRPIGFERGTVFEANRQHDLIALIFLREIQACLKIDDSRQMTPQRFEPFHNLGQLLLGRRFTEFNKNNMIDHGVHRPLTSLIFRSLYYIMSGYQNQPNLMTRSLYQACES